jgi:hypothetical protein
LSLIRCGGPSAIRTRTAAKRALSFPFVPVRQLAKGSALDIPCACGWLERLP